MLKYKIQINFTQCGLSSLHPFSSIYGIVGIRNCIKKSWHAFILHFRENSNNSNQIKYFLFDFVVYLIFLLNHEPKIAGEEFIKLKA